MILCLSGKARSGKDTLAKFLQKNLNDDYHLVAYATYLKKMCRDMFDLSIDQLYGDLKEVPDKRYPKPGVKTLPGHEQVYWTPREIMQFVGEAFRKVNPDYWVDKLFDFIDRNNIKNVIITDGRHTNEIDAVLNYGGCHIRVLREEDIRAVGQDHISETALDDFEYIDYIVQNTGTLEDLEDMAKQLVKEIEKDGRKTKTV